MTTTDYNVLISENGIEHHVKIDGETRAPRRTVQVSPTNDPPDMATSLLTAATDVDPDGLFVGEPTGPPVSDSTPQAHLVDRIVGHQDKRTETQY